MAKLTLFFKDKIVEVFHLLEDDSVTIGRDTSNTFSIDSLAVAPTHLTVSFEGNQYYIESVTEQFVSFINGKPIKKQPLQQGDRVQMAKHELLFTDDVVDFVNLAQNEQAPIEEVKKNTPITKSTEIANLQIMSGSDIGRVITLHSALTEIKQDEKIPAIIAKRQSGYYISKLIDNTEIFIGGKTIKNEAKLEHNAKFRIDKCKYVFFTE